MTKFAMTRWKVVPEYCPWSTYFRKCATVRGARSAFNSSVKLPIEVTTWTCGEAAGAAGAVGLGGALAAAAAPAAGLAAGGCAGACAALAAGVSVAAGAASAARLEAEQVAEINPKTISSCFMLRDSTRRGTILSMSATLDSLPV